MEKKRLIYNSKIEEICLGHMSVMLNHRCQTCKADELNKMCSGYKPIKYYTFNVMEWICKDRYEHPLSPKETLDFCI